MGQKFQSRDKIPKSESTDFTPLFYVQPCTVAILELETCVGKSRWAKGKAGGPT